MSTSTTDAIQKEGLDRVGAVASTLCAVHCALCALLPAAFGALGVGFLLGSTAEWAFTLIAIVFASGALWLGWRKHRSPLVAALLAIGILGLLASRGIESASGHHHEPPALAAHGANDGTSHHDGHIGHHEHGGHGGHDGHHDHQKQPHHKTEQHHKNPHAEGHGHHGDDHGDHDDAGHLFGAIVGILAGLILLVGHILNLRASRRCDDGCT